MPVWPVEKPEILVPPVSATLLNYPQGTAFATGSLVTFAFSGGVASQSASVIASSNPRSRGPQNPLIPHMPRA